MLTERPRKPSSLKDLSETAPTFQEVRELRQAFEELLQEKGEVGKYAEGFLADIFSIPLGGNKRISFSTKVEIEDKGIDVWVYRRENRNPSGESLIVDIGMMTNKGERVWLDLTPIGRAVWVYHDRSLIGQGISSESPTKRDLELHKEVLGLIKQSPKS